MGKFKPIHTRLLFIDLKIKDGKFPNCSSLAEEWEVDRKTIQRDLDYMRYELDAPIEYSKKQRGYYYTEEQFQLPAIDLKESDIFSVNIAKKILDQFQGSSVHDSILSIFRKIEEAIPSKVASITDLEQSRFTVIPAPRTNINPEILKLVFQSIRLNKSIEIKYHAPGNEPTIRTINPYHGLLFSGDWYVIAFCKLRNAIRIFSLARILSVKELDEIFIFPKNLDFDKFNWNYFGINWGNGKIDVKIYFHKDVAPYIKERQWDTSQAIEDNLDGSVILSMHTHNSNELRRWILSWDSMAKVLSPESLVNEVKNLLIKMKHNYQIV